MTRLATQSDAVLLSAVPFRSGQCLSAGGRYGCSTSGSARHLPSALRDTALPRATSREGKRFASGKTSWRQEPRSSPTMTQPSPLSVGFARDRTHSANARHGPCQLAPLLVSLTPNGAIRHHGGDVRPHPLRAPADGRGRRARPSRSSRLSSSPTGDPRTRRRTWFPRLRTGTL